MALERAVLTIVAGNSVYWPMAINLARSFVCWHKQSDIRLYILTDLSAELPKDLSEIEIVRVSLNKLGKGFSCKLWLDEFQPAAKTLFVDADSLIVGNLESVFDRFAGRPIAVVGDSISSGEWFGDIGSICSHFGVTSIPKFNGGIYYLEQSSLAHKTYKSARELERRYDELGLKRLRGRPNEELLMAISMSLHGLRALPDDGTIMSSPQHCPADLEISVLRGRSRLVNPPLPDRRHQSWYPFHVVHPLIVHFLGDYTSDWRYRAEAMKLQLVVGHGWLPSLAETFVRVFFSAGQNMIEKSKNLARPLYHATFGPRPVRKSPRIVAETDEGCNQSSVASDNDTQFFPPSCGSPDTPSSQSF